MITQCRKSVGEKASPTSFVSVSAMPYCSND